MFTLTPRQALLIGFIVAPILFALCAYFTRANVRRITGALVGAAAYDVINYGWDQAAVRFGWWSYPAWLGTGRAPLTLYVLAGIVRRWGVKGLVGFLLFWATYAVVHDYGGLKAFASSQLMIFGPGLLPILAIMLWYVTGNAAVLLAIRLVGGSLGDDPLARTKPVAAK